ncbi:MAG: hypothetical protein R3D00_29060 [Bacteroidia bacterium]
MSQSTTPLTVPDISRIPFLNEQARKIFHKRIDSIRDFSQLKTLHLGDNLNNYRKQTDRFDYPVNIKQLWQHFTQRKPHEIWSGSLTPYLFSYSKITRHFYYSGDPRTVPIHTGMQFFCMINIWTPVGIVGMEVMEIDPEKYSIEFAYIEGGYYRGVQRLEFIEQLNGRTRIIHHSYFQPENLLGRLIPYKFFHRKIINQFHLGMKNMLFNH